MAGQSEEGRKVLLRNYMHLYGCALRHHRVDGCSRSRRMKGIDVFARVTFKV